jgi:DNA-binding NtrC family response regulator
MMKVLTIDDEERALEVLCRSLTMLGYEATGLSNPKLVETALRKMTPDVVIVDLIMPQMGGIEVLGLIRNADADLPVIILTGHGTVKSAVEAMKKGAFDYITKPFDIEEVDLTIKRAIEQRELLMENKLLREKLLQQSPLSAIVTHDKSMLKLLRAVETIACTDSTVLVTGESGTGKELIAKALHFSGTRRDKPFITIDCGGLPETIIESEIFGHIKGSFTGAYADKKGYIEVGEGGSVFFDEISELPYFLQRKLLRVIQEKEFSKVGDTKTRKADIHIIAASNKDLKSEVEAGRFREDLFYRLNVVSLSLPPLRDRPQDIPLLANYFLAALNLRFKKRVTAISEEACSRMMAYAWPGNVRELKNAMERIVIFKEDSVVTVENLPEEIQAAEDRQTEHLRSLKELREETLTRVTAEYVATLLAIHKGNVSKAAAKAGLDRGNFRKIMKRFSISAERYR